MSKYFNYTLVQTILIDAGNFELEHNVLKWIQCTSVALVANEDYWAIKWWKFAFVPLVARLSHFNIVWLFYAAVTVHFVVTIIQIIKFLFNSFLCLSFFNALLKEVCE